MQSLPAGWRGRAPPRSPPKAWGETRYTWGTTPTTYRYTGQREQAEVGLYYYGARSYDPYTARFTQPDTIVPTPTNPQGFNRYSYVKNRPVLYTDPTGHCIPGVDCPGDGDKGEETTYPANAAPPEINTSKRLPTELQYGDNYGSRNGSPILGIVMHMTQGYDVDGAISGFDTHGTSAHYIVDRDGTIYQIIPDEYRADHAGGTGANPGKWAAMRDRQVSYEGSEVNEHTLGIEMVGFVPEKAPEGDEEYVGFTEAQRSAVSALVANKAYAYGIFPYDIVAHATVCKASGSIDGGEYLEAIRSYTARSSRHYSPPAGRYGGAVP